MMQVKLKVLRVSRDFSQRPGQVIRVSDDEGERLIALGHAERCERVAGCERRAERAPETACVQPLAERTVRKRGRPRKVRW